MSGSVYRPLIGISTEADTVERYWGTSAHHLITETYVDSVRAAGGTAVLLPVGNADEAAAVIDRLDALVITGGNDIDPVHYGEPRVDVGTGGTLDPLRDEFDLALARGALESGLPTLCVCRGHQVLNVALGGSLIQHLTEHAATPFPGDVAERYDTQELIVDPTSLFAERFPTITAANSFHHQAVGRLGRGVRVAATATDGVVEVIEVEGAPHIVSVQWHPEEMPHLAEHQGLFRWLVAAAHERRLAQVG